MMMMMRMLGQVLMGAEGGGQSLFSTIKIAVLPIAKVFTMCFLGFLMASKLFIPFNVVLATISGSLIGLLVETIETLAMCLLSTQLCVVIRLILLVIQTSAVR